MTQLIAVGLVAAIIGAYIPAAIARDKGYPFGLWWLFGFFFLPFAITAAVLVDPRPEAPMRYALAAGGRRCPHCGSVIARTTTVCRFCTRDVEPVLTPPPPRGDGWPGSTTSAWFVVGVFVMAVVTAAVLR